MKGRQLSLQEVLNLEDGSKVWVEESDEEYKEWSKVYTVNQEERRLYTRKGEFYRFDSYAFEDGDVEFYEWIDGVKSINISGVKGTMNGEYYNKSIIVNLATEICNLRGLDFTDENIEKIIKEFS